MNEALFLELKQNFNNRINFRDKGKNIYQIIAPFYHEDGDMYDIFLDISEDGSLIKVCDHGLTLMRLSYTYELDTPKKEEIFFQILHGNNIENDNGNLWIEVSRENLYMAVLRFTQIISKISNMQLFRREVIRSMFYDDLQGFIMEEFPDFSPINPYLPIPEREDLEVDFCFQATPKKLFLFGVKDNAKARLVTISCLEYMRNTIPFRSIVVHEDFESLSSKDRKIITNVVDKQFTDFADFKSNAKVFFNREIA
ncbi:MAG: DUF1828 domain-containing protein [Tannerellaceae bacterium]|jgi:hypothetical protein|nr:DUF1828 domain-containing protein [Tannerellaceae bacterium]